MDRRIDPADGRMETEAGLPYGQVSSDAIAREAASDQSKDRAGQNSAMPAEAYAEWGPPPRDARPPWNVPSDPGVSRGDADPTGRFQRPEDVADSIQPAQVRDNRDAFVNPNALGGPAERPFDNRLPPDAPSAPPSEATPCEGAEILGRVGSEVILAKEVSWGIAELRAQNKEAPQDLLEAKIREILKQRVAQKIDERLIVQDAQRTIPKDNFPKIRENVAREFEASQIPRLMKTTGARTREELDRLLEASGSSIEMQKKNFVDAVLANEWLRHQVKIDEDVGHQEMLDYYRQHLSEFETPARARWEQLTVRVARFATREEAYAALAQMGNQVLDGAPLAEVARAQSHGSTAQQGGAWDWTSQGSLASALLDRVIFGDGVRPGIPVGALSPILEEEQALHIIRVIEREPPRRTPFEQAQVEIKKKIRAEREVKAKQDYLAKLRRQTPVWTAFDTPATAATPAGWLR